MIPWQDVFNICGFKLSYCKHPSLTFGWSFSFVLGNFYAGIGVNPEDKNT